MILYLQALPRLRGPDDRDYKGNVPKRSLYMQPEAAKALLAADISALVFTDVYRSPQVILQAYRTRPGTQPVSSSFHGYGGCVDLDVQATLKRLGKDYAWLCAHMENHGFYCHRRDGIVGCDQSEGWHFNYLGADAPKLLALTTADHTTWAAPAEAMIQKWYGAALQPDDVEVERLLRSAGVSDIRTFQRKWDLVPDGIMGPRTRRVLAFVTATVQIETDLSALV